MEAVPKLPLISFEVKVSHENTHFGPKLKQYIAEAYREDPDSYSNEIHQLEGLRSAAVRATIDNAGLSALIRYFCQLRAMQSRFPMAKGQPAACSFNWKDLYANMSCALADIRFEMACILYNIGAMHTELGALEPRNTADSMKAACTHYQNAAWAFQYLREHYPQPTGVDVSTEIMRLLQEICFGQAQECILEKSIQDARKPTVVGAVATQVMYFYKNSLALLGPSAGSDTIHEIVGNRLYNFWHRYLSFKVAYIGCIVCLYQGMHAEEQQKMGDRVAFYQQAVEKLNEARKLVKHMEPPQIAAEAITFTNDVVEGKRKAAKNENEFIYHEEVPDKDLLVDMKPVCLVKALPINFNDPEVTGPDLFARLVPMGAHEASSMYSEEKAKLLRHIVSQVEIKNTELTEFMSSLQLDQLDVLDSDQKVPQEIVDRCAAMNAKSEVIQTLVDSMNNLAEIIGDVEHSLAEIKNLIQEETQKEKDFQKTMGPRPPSIVQTELSREYHKYQEAHTRTNESNQVLHKAMTLHIANLRLLAQPLDVLEAKIPNIDGIAGLDRETMSEMRRILSKVKEMQSQRDALVAQLREAITSDDITGQLLARSTEPTEEIFKQEIEKHTPKVKIIEQNLAAQENIINKVTSVYASYGDSRRLLTDVLRKRDGLINALITSYDTYEELLGKSQKGLEFYKKLSHNISQLLTRLRSTCQVQEEERAQLLAKQNKVPSPPSTPTPPPSRTPELSTSQAITMAGGSRKLKDYLPYMKNRNSRNVVPQVPMDNMPQESYYPESIYPTSVRPAPVGSEATDIQIPDGVMPQTVPSYSDNYYEHDPSFPPTNLPSVPSYAYPATSKAFEKPTEDYGYSNYTPTQIPDQIPHSYNYYPTQSTTPVSETQAAHVSRQTPNTYYDYNQIQTIPESSMPSMAYPNQADLSTNFSQMQVSHPKSDYNTDYSQTFYSIHYPNVSTPNPASYTNAPHNSATSIAHSQIPSEIGSLNYPYSSEGQYDQGVPNVPFSTPTDPYAYATSFASTSQGLTHANITNPSPSIASNTSTASYPYQTDETYNPALAQLDAYDKPIKSHVTGEALSAPTFQPGYENYGTNVPSFASQAETYNTQNPTNTYPYQDQTNFNQDSQNYSQTYQNHPGYNFNTATGNYEYNYGSQNSYSGYINTQQANMNPNAVGKDQNWSAPHYTSAGNVGTCETVQSPTETTQVVPQSNQANNQMYYNTPYGYQNVQNEAAVTPVQAPVQVPVQTSVQVPVQAPVPVVSQATTYNTNTYTQPDHNTSYAQVSSEPEPIENVNTVVTNTPVEQNVENSTPVETKPIKEEKADLSAFDLLSDIDFTVEHTPLMPQIKVPQISESAIRKPVIKAEPVKKVLPVKEEVIERPPKRDVFSDPSLVNQFTQEVKKLQKLTESLTEKTSSGLTLLDAKWKTFQDVQNKECASRTRRVAMQHTSGNIVTEVVPYDDSRLTLKSDPDAYINASYYKELAPWCIPLVLSKTPIEREYSVFWKAILEYKISCIVCLSSEIDMQGNFYWPTAKGQTHEFGNLKVVLNDVICTVHWTERKITVTCGKTVLDVTHYQINVFPAKIVCSPLVMLSDAVLSASSGGAWLHGAGGGSALLALLLLLIVQVRAGQVTLTEILDSGCVNLYKGRTNVLEDTKYLADTYKTALFYVQGVLCSGTTMFNGEAVSLPSGAGVLPPVQPSISKTMKFSRESFEEMKQSPGLTSGDMKDPLNFLDPLWSLKKK